MDFRPLPKNFRGIPEKAKKVFEGVIFDVYQWNQEMFDGTTEVFEMLKRPDTIGVLPLHGENVVVIDEEQPNTKREESLPFGRVNKDESVLDAAYRELEEETGIVPADLYYVDSTKVTGKIDWLVHFFISKEIKEQKEIHLDAGEKIISREISIDGFIERHKKGDFAVDMPKIFTDCLIANDLGKYKDMLVNPEKYFKKVTR